jgi:hypothetical protein
MLLFRTLALQLEQRMPEFVGRTERNLRLALELNRQAGNWVDAEQLEAAIYMHDVGMMFLPEAWLKLAASATTNAADGAAPGLGGRPDGAHAGLGGGCTDGDAAPRNAGWRRLSLWPGQR